MFWYAVLAVVVLLLVAAWWLDRRRRGGPDQDRLDAATSDAWMKGPGSPPPPWQDQGW